MTSPTCKFKMLMIHSFKYLQAMSIMGLYDSAYWLSWFTWEAFLTVVAALFTVLFGMMFQFNFFLHNSFAVLFLLFFLFQLNMVIFSLAYVWHLIRIVWI